METGTIVIGGGSAGAVAAARLAQAGEDVVLLEAGPDYGRLDSGRWPQELLDPSLMPLESHSWGFSSSATRGRQGMDLQRARVIGGCSSHNGCAVVWGHREDYDGWEALGNPGWAADDLTPYLERATSQLEVVTPPITDLTPFHQTVLDAAPAAGLPFIDDVLNLDAAFGFGVVPVNIRDGVRWNTSFAYLDAARELPNFSIVGDALATRIELVGQSFSHLRVKGAESELAVHAERVVIACGAYGTPQLLQRSGIGSRSDLEQAGIETVHELSGVGHHLMDHPAIQLRYSGTEQLTCQLDDFVEGGGMPREEGTVALTQSSRCDGAFDLHLYPIAHRNGPGDWGISISAAVVASKSTGSVNVTDSDPDAKPLIDHGYLTDPDGYDLDALVEAVNQIRSLASREPLAGLLGEETIPGQLVRTRDELRDFVLHDATHDYHPTSSCRMGPEDHHMSCVGPNGSLYGLEGIVVTDASIMPRVPVANTNLPTIAVAEKIAENLLNK